MWRNVNRKAKGRHWLINWSMPKKPQNLDVCAFGGSGQSPGLNLDACAYGGSGISPPSVKLCQNINVKLCQEISVNFRDNLAWVFVPRFDRLGTFTCSCAGTGVLGNPAYSCTSTGVLGIFTYSRAGTGVLGVNTYSQRSTGVLGINTYDTHTNCHRHKHLSINTYDTCLDWHRYKHPCATCSTVIGINTYPCSTGVLRRKRELREEFTITSTITQFFFWIFHPPIFSEFQRAGYWIFFFRASWILWLPEFVIFEIFEIFEILVWVNDVALKRAHLSELNQLAHRMFSEVERWALMTRCLHLCRWWSTALVVRDLWHQIPKRIDRSWSYRSPPCARPQRTDP